jgi:hypothetical protein
MSIYDDLADSGYLDKDEFRKHLQINSHMNPSDADMVALSRLTANVNPNFAPVMSQYGKSDSAKVI